jgi:uncharacterized tellurite resistance protein B-like protein
MTDEEKSALGLMMVEMIKADGDIDRGEVEIFTAVFIATGIPMPELN